MEDKELLETIENYLTGAMSSQERTEFEALRKNTPEIDQMVVEHKLFLDHMQSYAIRRSFAKLTSQTFNKLMAAGEWMTDDTISTKTKVIQLWNRYKRVTAIAASVAGFIALTTTVLVMSLSPSLNGNQLLQLSKAIEVIKKNQQVQGHLINEVKSKVPENAKMLSGGSGFLIDTKGFIITNTHVLKGNGAIVINNLGQELHANIIYSDINSDLALLKIDDEDFKAPKNIPFVIRKKMTDLGEEIFTLGYPRNDNDIVYGKGYLSAQTGYNGDSNSYQIQISANPGYSGAPLFNDKGEIIGIINTRQKQAEGVAFAVKSNKIFDLIESVNETESKKVDKIKLPKSNTANLNNRKDQISNLKNYIYSIRSYN
ncbi:MAG: serine protease [Sediminibacterium sp.]|nr:MAG: serine protease [Sediminibacterium sp.]